MESMLTHFHGRFDVETGCCKIRVLSAHRGAPPQKKCVFVYRDLKEELKNDPQFLTKVVTGDESWC